MDSLGLSFYSHHSDGPLENHQTAEEIRLREGREICCSKHLTHSQALGEPSSLGARGMGEVVNNHLGCLFLPPQGREGNQIYSLTTGLGEELCTQTHLTLIHRKSILCLTLGTERLVACENSCVEVVFKVKNWLCKKKTHYTRWDATSIQRIGKTAIIILKKENNIDCSLFRCTFQTVRNIQL